MVTFERQYMVMDSRVLLSAELAERYADLSLNTSQARIRVSSILQWGIDRRRSKVDDAFLLSHEWDHAHEPKANRQGDDDDDGGILAVENSRAHLRR